MYIRPANPDALAKLLHSKPLILYGMGETGERIAKWCKEYHLTYIQSDKRAKELQTGSAENKIVLPERIVCDYPEANIVISSIAYMNEIYEDLLQFGVQKENILLPFSFMSDQVSLKELEVNGCVHWERLYQGCAMIAEWEWIPEQIKSVVDYSAGKGMPFKKYISETTAYYPIDYMDRGQNTTICDFAKSEFPDIDAELSVCFAMSLYTTAAGQLIDNICEHTGRLSIFTSITLEGMPDVRLRRYSGIVNDFTEKQIIDRFSANYFAVRDKRYHTAGNSTMTFFLFERTGDAL